MSEDRKLELCSIMRRFISKKITKEFTQCHLKKLKVTVEELRGLESEFGVNR